MVRRLDRLVDRMRGTVTYELGDGRYITLDAEYVATVGVKECLRREGIEMPTERKPVYQRGEKIGTLPGDFDPMFIRPRSFLYQPRGGDFIWDGDKWIADRMLGPGDLDAVFGFEWDRRGA